MSPSDYQRWYDKDPILSQALETLRKAEDRYQAQIALNIILIVVEHHIEARTLATVDALVDTLEQSQEQSKQYFRRWYDLNETLRSAMQLLQDCPDDVQQKVIPSISKMVEDSLKETQ
jgi:hypothetical protein